MSDDRTIEPSPRRLREARQRGTVPVSAELTAAVAVLAVVAALGVTGESIADGLASLIRGSLGGAVTAEDEPAFDPLDADPRAFVVRVRSAVDAVAMPVLALLAAPLVAALLAHQAQVGGLFVPSLAMPDPARLAPGARGGSPADRLGRALGILLRTALLVALTWWTIRSIVQGFDAPASTDPSALVRSFSGSMHGALLRFGLALLSVGLAHYGWQVRRVRARLRMTPEEHREEQRSQGGDPSLRSRRRAVRDRTLAAGPAEAAGAAESV